MIVQGLQIEIDEKLLLIFIVFLKNAIEVLKKCRDNSTLEALEQSSILDHLSLS